MLHPYVSQRLISLFETLAKKHARLDADMKRIANGNAVGISVDIDIESNGTQSKEENLPASTVLNMSGSNNTKTMVVPDTAVQSMVLEDLLVLEEVLRMVLEILNSCISHQLVYCPNLVYTLLYKRQVFESFRSHPAFQDIIQNIDMVSESV